MKGINKMETIRTPDAHFEGLAGYDFEPHYMTIDDGMGGTIRMHYLDQGPRDGEVILCLHGNPSWSYLYKDMIPVFVNEGFRVIAPDLIGFGRSDKPTRLEDHTYDNHVRWLSQWFKTLNVNCNLFCQDWGGLLGLRLVAEKPDQFLRVVAGNTSLPDGYGRSADKAQPMRELYETIPVVNTSELFKKFAEKSEAPGYWYWRKFCAESPEFRLSVILSVDPAPYSKEELAANEAPYPDESYLCGPRGFPGMAPIFPDDPQLELNRQAWKRLESFDRPFQTAFSDDDYVASPGDESSFQNRIAGAQDVQHIQHHRMGHFLRKPEVAQAVIDFIRANPV
ncbi:haloalkane dehalogenase [Pseudoteredinibacter isoporae]|uniref:Haloalkane dehalogenase n=1 Tax=Pseudoteredinibacter isoporae TaxID=570281 RepID=A0A7X0JSI7_9GAMM|nr:haloalkane dehalogenase [Pseudoteredinibacter isoporae]MBB6521495.1 haloalkane dehalogenase [Pseudoteredinibacter isoporae]